MHLINAIVDWYRKPYAPPPRKKMLTVLGLALLLNFLDGFLTFVNVTIGLSHEVNPVPAMMIETGWWLFFLVKIGAGSAVIYYTHRRLVPGHILGWYTMIGVCIVLGFLVLNYIAFLVVGIAIQIIY